MLPQLTPILTWNSNYITSYKISKEYHGPTVHPANTHCSLSIQLLRNPPTNMYPSTRSPIHPPTTPSRTSASPSASVLPSPFHHRNHNHTLNSSPSSPLTPASTSSSNPSPRTYRGPPTSASTKTTTAQLQPTTAMWMWAGISVAGIGSMIILM